MDIDEEKKVVSPSKKRKLSKAAEAKLKANEKKKKGKKGSDDDDDEDAYTALSKSHWASNTQRPPIGNFEICSTCEKQFTVVSVTPHLQFPFDSYTIFRQNIQWHRARTTDFYVTSVPKLEEMILLKSLQPLGNAKRPQRREISQLFKSEDFQLLFLYVFKYVNSLALPCHARSPL